MNTKLEQNRGQQYIEECQCNTLIIGSGAAAFNAADSLYDLGVKDILLVTEGIYMGTSRNTGSDKQTYYKLSLASGEPDSVYDMARSLYDGQSVNGDTALVEAALSARCFFKLVNLGVPFPCDKYGQYAGYKTDHDPKMRGTSCGPLTSKYMTQQLEQSVKKKNIPILDHVRIIRLLTCEEQGEMRVYGAIGLKNTGKSWNYVRFRCSNIIYATGGPGGIYHNSVYPVSQTCAHGAAILCGADCANVTEWQYGIASVKFRWNLSGSYQQVIPRYVSVNEQGEDEREFLEDYFAAPSELLTAIFLKGYQWPFDPRKLERGGSSIIDFAVYQETVVRGRRVFLDYTRNPKAAEKEGAFDFTLLSEEARAYLENSQVMFGTPVQRLMKMNRPAYELYKARRIDLEKEWLQVSVCAQHNNGGLYADRWWQSNIRRLFPVGEVCGNFGVYRPGGSALNATQVGSLRAAQYISRNGQEPQMDWERFLQLSQSHMDEVIFAGLRLLEKGQGKKKPLELRKRYQREMDEAAAFIREEKGICRQIQRCRAYIADFYQETLAETPRELTDAWINYDILHTQLVYLTGMLVYIQEKGKSRGSYMIAGEDFRFNEVKETGIRTQLDQGERAELIQICSLRQGQVVVENRQRKPLPDGKVWFETVYNDCLQDAVIGQ